MGGTVKSFSEIAQVLFGMKAVDDLVASGNCSSAMFQIQAAPSPSTAVRDTWQKRRRVASRQTRSAKGDRLAAVSSVHALSKAAE